MINILTFFVVAIFLYEFRTSFGHGLMSYPIPRGGTSGRSKFIKAPVNKRYTTDHKLHFPAGDKANVAGAAVRSQMKNAGKKGWTMYNPFDPSFHWRYGVCGDLPKGNDHLKGGIFYNGGQIVETFRQGETISIEMTIVASHNGYIELFVCDVDKCPKGEISPECFISPSKPCAQLMRIPNEKCDSRESASCGPIDDYYPGRWYLPCPMPVRSGETYVYGKDKSIQYQLPANLSCEHCVLQFSWVSANFCNPPGYVDYFTGPSAPLWGNCRGQGNARGGVNKNLPTCGGKRFSEEYLMCSDIRIT